MFLETRDFSPGVVHYKKIRLDYYYPSLGITVSSITKKTGPPRGPVIRRYLASFQLALKPQ